MAYYLMVLNPKNIRPVTKNFEVLVLDVYVQNVNFQTKVVSIGAFLIFFSAFSSTAFKSSTPPNIVPFYLIAV